MKTLITFASNSGSTKTVAKIIFEVFQQSNLLPTIKEAKDVEIEDIQIHDVILVGSPSWLVNDQEGQPLESVTKMLEKIKTADLFKNRQWAAFGCGDKSYLNFCMAVDIIEDTITSNSGTLIDHGLRIDSFFFDQKKNETAAADWATKITKKISVTTLIS